MNCIRLIALSVAICWSAVAAADTLTTNLTTYSTGDAITIVFTTTSLYETVAIDVNGIIVKTLTDIVNLITGTITYTGFVTCPMGTSGAVTSLVINATTTLPSNPPTITATTTVGYTYVAANCLAYFTTPSSNPATIPAAQQYTAAIATTTVAFTDAYITLNGQFFCSLGAVPASGTASCAGFVPCFLPCSAQFAIVGKETAAAYVTYTGPTVQLTPNASCNPVFSSKPGFGDGCPDFYTPLTTIAFNFTINPNDNIATYSNFEIYATNSFLATPVFVAKVPGPLCIINEISSTFVIKNWLIPCEFNNLGATIFTLTYTQIFSNSEKILAAQTLSFTIGVNVECNLTLVVNYLGSCPLPYTPSDCQCLASSSSKGYSVVPCGNCPCCPSLSIPPVSTFEPGDTLNFYVHNGSIGLSNGTGQVTAINVTPYYDNPIGYNGAVSVINFYVDYGVNSFGYKLIQNMTNTITFIPDGGANIGSISAWTTNGADIIWAYDSISQTTFCGDVSGMSPAGLSPLPNTSSYHNVAVGPQGLWLIANTGFLYWRASTSCSDPTNFAPVASSPPNLLVVSQGLNGVWISDYFSIWYLTGPTATPLLVPPGGPASSRNHTGSSLNDSLTLISGLGATGTIWYLSSPTGTWTELSQFNDFYAVYNYGNDLIYGYENTPNLETFKIQLSDWKYFPSSSYYNVSLVINSSLPPLTLFETNQGIPFDSCNNDLAASWTIPSNYKNVGPTTATLSYEALFPWQVPPLPLSSSVTFTIGPTPVDLLKPRDFCPSVTSSTLI